MKWTKRFWLDLTERVGSVFAYQIITLLTTFGFAELKGLNMEELWPILVVPPVLSLLKGLLANAANAESGASLLPAPPGPSVQDGNAA